MGILYAWATKEYLLEHMSFKQISMYVKHGAEIKWPTPKKENGPVTSVGKSAAQLRAERDKLRKHYGS